LKTKTKSKMGAKINIPKGAFISIDGECKKFTSKLLKCILMYNLFSQTLSVVRYQRVFKLSYLEPL